MRPGFAGCNVPANRRHWQGHQPCGHRGAMSGRTLIGIRRVNTKASLAARKRSERSSASLDDTESYEDRGNHGQLQVVPHVRPSPIDLAVPRRSQIMVNNFLRMARRAARLLKRERDSCGPDRAGGGAHGAARASTRQVANGLMARRRQRQRPPAVSSWRPGVALKA